MISGWPWRARCGSTWQHQVVFPIRLPFGAGGQQISPSATLFGSWAWRLLEGGRQALGKKLLLLLDHLEHAGVAAALALGAGRGTSSHCGLRGFRGGFGARSEIEARWGFRRLRSAMASVEPLRGTRGRGSACLSHPGNPLWAARLEVLILWNTI